MQAAGTEGQIRSDSVRKKCQKRQIHREGKQSGGSPGWLLDGESGVSVGVGSSKPHYCSVNPTLSGPHLGQKLTGWVFKGTVVWAGDGGTWHGTGLDGGRAAAEIPGCRLGSRRVCVLPPHSHLIQTLLRGNGQKGGPGAATPSSARGRDAGWCCARELVSILKVTPGSSDDCLRKLGNGS